jgi:hypothetical protein
MRFVAKVVIIREIADDGDLIDHVVTEDPDGDPIPLVEALGMLRLAEHTIIDSRMDGEHPL